MMRILLIEDEADLAQAVVQHLHAAAVAVDHVGLLEDARAALAGHSYDLILLDLQLPDGLGLELLREIRARRDQTPVLITTARDRITERIAGLEAGADDYLVKPFDLDEMRARILAILRRVDQDRSPARLFGRLAVRPAERQVLLDGVAVALTAREWAVIEHLSRHPARIVPKGDLESSVYEFGEEVQSNAIEAHVSRLRSKLGREVIETVRGLGYRMGRVA